MIGNPQGANSGCSFEAIQTNSRIFVGFMKLGGNRRRLDSGDLEAGIYLQPGSCFSLVGNGAGAGVFSFNVGEVFELFFDHERKCHINVGGETLFVYPQAFGFPLQVKVCFFEDHCAIRNLRFIEGAAAAGDQKAMLKRLFASHVVVGDPGMKQALSLVILLGPC